MFDSTIVNAVIGAIATIAVGIIGVWTARLAKRSAQATAHVEERAKVVEGYDKLNEDLEKRNEVLSNNVTKLELRVDELETKQIEDRRMIREVEEERYKERRYFRILLDYTNTLVMKMRSANLDVPTLPVEVTRYAYPDGQE